MANRDRSNEAKAVALLATCFVVGAGGVACLFIAFVSGHEDPMRPLLIAAGCFVGIIALLWLLRQRPENRAAVRWGWLGRRRKKVEYHLTPRRSRPPESPAAPPTAESIRELGGGIHTWVPSQTAPVRDERKPSSKRRPK
jgi:hypothetical protein